MTDQWCPGHGPEQSPAQPCTLLDGPSSNYQKTELNSHIGTLITRRQNKRGENLAVRAKRSPDKGKDAAPAGREQLCKACKLLCCSSHVPHCSDSLKSHQFKQQQTRLCSLSSWASEGLADLLIHDLCALWDNRSKMRFNTFSLSFLPDPWLSHLPSCHLRFNHPVTGELEQKNESRIQEFGAGWLHVENVWNPTSWSWMWKHSLGKWKEISKMLKFQQCHRKVRHKYTHNIVTRQNSSSYSWRFSMTDMDI